MASERIFLAVDAGGYATIFVSRLPPFKGDTGLWHGRDARALSIGYESDVVGTPPRGGWVELRPVAGTVEGET